MKLLVEIPDTTKIIADTENFNSFSYPVWVSSCINAIRNGQSLPEDCEILTKEAYDDLCMKGYKKLVDIEVVKQKVFEITDLYDSGEYIVYEDGKYKIGNDIENETRMDLTRNEALQGVINGI